MPRGARSNQLALAVLVCLLERSMHPYEMATMMRQRGKHESIKLNYGSLYTVVQNLEKRGLIEPQETERQGRRPERTIYRLTPAGHVELVDWLSELLSTPTKEFSQFEAGLSIMAALPPEDVLELLKERAIRLELAVAQARSVAALMDAQSFPRLFRIESEFSMVRLEAELGWLRTLIDDFVSERFDGLQMWRKVHGDHPEEVLELVKGSWELWRDQNPAVERPNGEVREGPKTN